MHLKNGQTSSELRKGNGSPTYISYVMNQEEEKEDLNASYNVTSLDGGDLSSPPPLGIIEVIWRRFFMKGQGEQLKKLLLSI